MGLLTGLTYLSLYENFSLNGVLPSELGQLTDLQSLDLVDNDFSGNIPTELTQLTSLTLIGLYGNLLTGTVPTGFCSPPFPDWRGDGSFGSFRLLADCEDTINELQCDCCDVCYDENGNRYDWLGNPI